MWARVGIAGSPRGLLRVPALARPLSNPWNNDSPLAGVDRSSGSQEDGPVAPRQDSGSVSCEIPLLLLLPLQKRLPGIQSAEEAKWSETKYQFSAEGGLRLPSCAHTLCGNRPSHGRQCSVDIPRLSSFVRGPEIPRKKVRGATANKSTPLFSRVPLTCPPFVALFLSPDAFSFLPVDLGLVTVVQLERSSWKRRDSDTV